ncbi:MAG: hypothetical protein ACJATA_002126 [Sphingobacteriales bacterium]|jgi:hypothetical protein
MIKKITIDNRPRATKPNSMNFKKITVKLGAIAFMGLAFASCQKDGSDSEYELAEEAIYSKMMDQEIEEDVDMLTLHKKEFSKEEKERHFNNCAVITYDTAAFPKVITIDFGDGCEGRRGKEKAGKIIITLSDSLYKTGATRTVEFDNFTIDGNPVIGSKILENKGINSDGNMYFEHNETFKVTTDRGEISKESSGTKEWMTGFDTKTKEDDVFRLTGSGTFTSPKGTSSRTIAEPLIIDRSCGYPTQGIIEFTGGKKDDISINYGDGTCDDLAVITKDGEEKEIYLDDLKKRKRRHK